MPTSIQLNKLKDCIGAFCTLQKALELATSECVANTDDYHKTFSVFAEILKKDSRCNAALNIFDLCSLGRDELRNCRVLAWWLDMYGSHGLGCRFLARLLSSVSKGMPVSRQ